MNAMDNRRDRRRYGWPSPWLLIMFFVFGLPMLGRLLPMVGPLLIMARVVYFIFAKLDPEGASNLFRSARQAVFTPSPENAETTRLNDLATEAMHRAGHDATWDQLRLND